MCWNEKTASKHDWNIKKKSLNSTWAAAEWFSFSNTLSTVALHSAVRARSSVSRCVQSVLHVTLTVCVDVTKTDSSKKMKNNRTESVQKRSFALCRHSSEHTFSFTTHTLVTSLHVLSDFFVFVRENCEIYWNKLPQSVKENLLLCNMKVSKNWFLADFFEICWSRRNTLLLKFWKCSTRNSFYYSQKRPRTYSKLQTLYFSNNKNPLCAVSTSSPSFLSSYNC